MYKACITKCVYSAFDRITAKQYADSCHIHTLDAYNNALDNLNSSGLDDSCHVSTLDALYTVCNALDNLYTQNYSKNNRLTAAVNQ